VERTTYIEHVEKQPGTLFYIEPTLVAVPVNVVSLNIFQNEIRLTVGGHARVQ
jgi:hypothetical protein